MSDASQPPQEATTTIGEYAVIGANSVASRSILGRCIATGSPACVLKPWDDEHERWVARDGRGRGT